MQENDERNCEYKLLSAVCDYKLGSQQCVDALFAIETLLDNNCENNGIELTFSEEGVSWKALPVETSIPVGFSLPHYPEPSVFEKIRQSVIDDYISNMVDFLYDGFRKGHPEFAISERYNHPKKGPWIDKTHDKLTIKW